MKKFQRYIDLILTYNKVHNISGVKNQKDVEKNIEDSLYPMNFIDFSNIRTILDIGSGAGFPAMILAIEFNDIKFTLVEPISKKTAFLHLVKSTYGLQNVDIITERLENIDAFEVDLITSRAVAKVKFLIQLSKRFSSKGSQYLFYKGNDVYDELQDEDNMDYEIVKKDRRNYLWIKGISQC